MMSMSYLKYSMVKMHWALLCNPGQTAHYLIVLDGALELNDARSGQDANYIVFWMVNVDLV